MREEDLPEVDSLSQLLEFGVVFEKRDRSITDASLYEVEKAALGIGWDPKSFSFFRNAIWSDMHLSVGDYGKLDEDGKIAPNTLDPRSVLDQKGEAPSESYTFEEPTDVVTLPDGLKCSPLDKIMKARRSRRAYTHEPLSLEKLAHLLKLTFGPVWRGEKRDNLSVVRRTSPAGGSMHATECIVVALNVEQLVSGIYHYNSEKHALDRIVRRLDQDILIDAVQEIAAGQYFVRSAAAMLIFFTRFDRLFWKYFDHDRALAVSFLDIGHLSQTCLLKACELGVGATFSAAISEQNTNRILGLDGFTQCARAFVALGSCLEEFQKNLETDIHWDDGQ